MRLHLNSYFVIEITGFADWRDACCMSNKFNDTHDNQCFCHKSDEKRCGFCRIYNKKNMPRITIEENTMPKFIDVGVDKAKELISSLNDLVVLDKRDIDSYKQGHIEGAMMAHDGLIESMVKKGDKKIPILVYCYQGNSSKEVAELFSHFGYEQVYSLSGGYTEWKRAND